MIRPLFSTSRPPPFLGFLIHTPLRPRQRESDSDGSCLNAFLRPQGHVHVDNATKDANMNYDKCHKYDEHCLQLGRLWIWYVMLFLAPCPSFS